MLRKTRLAATEVLPHQLGENASDSDLIPHSNDSQPLAAYAPVPPRRYDNDLPLYSKLSVDKGKQRH